MVIRHIFKNVSAHESAALNPKLTHEAWIFVAIFLCKVFHGFLHVNTCTWIVSLSAPLTAKILKQISQIYNATIATLGNNIVPNVKVCIKKVANFVVAITTNLHFIIFINIIRQNRKNDGFAGRISVGPFEFNFNAIVATNCPANFFQNTCHVGLLIR